MEAKTRNKNGIELFQVKSLKFCMAINFLRVDKGMMAGP